MERVATPDVLSLVDLEADQIEAGGMPELQEPVSVWSFEEPLRVDLPGFEAVRHDVPLTGDGEVEVSATIRTEGLVPGPKAAGASLEIDELDENGKVLNHHTYLRRLTGDTPSTVVEATFEPNSKTRTLRLMPVPSSPTAQASGVVYFERIDVTRPDPLRRFLAAPSEANPFVKRVKLRSDSRMAWILAPGTQIEQEIPAGPRRELTFGMGTASLPKACIDVQAGEVDPKQVCGRKRGHWSEHRIVLGATETPVTLRWTVPEGGSVFVAHPTVVPSEPEPVPAGNVVLIVVDTLRGDAMSWAGSDATPTLAAFAQHALVYDHAFSTSSWTAPSMGSIVTSHYPLQHGAGLRVPFAVRQDNRNNSQLRKNELNYQLLDRDFRTIGEVMHDAGFETVGFYTNYFFSSNVGFDQGFERYEQYPGSRPTGATPGKSLVNRWLANRSKARPFFLTFHAVDPHLPYHSRKQVAKQFPPEEVDGLVVDGDIAVMKTVTRKAKKHPERVRAVYDDEVRWVDQVLGDIIEAVLAHDPNTTFILTSDHGEAFGEHGAFVHGNIMYNELVHVPMMVKVPGSGFEGHRSEAVSLIDVAPTVAAAAGVVPDPAWKGVSLLSEVPERTLFMNGTYSGPDRAGVVRWPHKLVWKLPERGVGFAVNPGLLHVNNLEESFQETKPIDDRSVIDPLEQQAIAHLQEHQPGLHIACGSGQDTLQVTASSPLGQILTPTLEKADQVTLSADKRTADLTLTDDADWVVLRSRFGMADSEITVAGKPLEAGARPEAMPEKGCVAWLNTTQGALVGDDAGSEAIDELRLLGYVE